MPVWHPISDCIYELNYDEDTTDLLVIFQDGESYIYPEFPWRTLMQWVNAPSIGAFYNIAIRGRFGGPEDWPGA